MHSLAGRNASQPAQAGGKEEILRNGQQAVDGAVLEDEAQPTPNGTVARQTGTRSQTS